MDLQEVSDDRDPADRDPADRVRLQPGEQVPGTRYRLQGWLGDAATGVLYEATHLDLERTVTIKVLHPEHTADPHRVTTFREEARAASRIGSPYIVAVSDFTELPDGRLMYVMERLQGVRLDAEVQRAPMAPSRLIAILRQVCKGLAAAHDEGLVHRDLKPETIVLLDTPRGGRADAVKVMDFGVAAMAGSKAKAQGTAAYMAPEAIMGMGTARQSDIYALGCVAYELLCGEPPFVGANKQVLRMHLRELPTPPSRRLGAEAIPAPLERVVLWCLAKKRKDRPADMRQLEAALCEAQLDAGLCTAWDDLPLPQVDAETHRRLSQGFAELQSRSQPRRSSRRLVSMAAAAAGLAAVLTAVAVPRWLDTPPPQQTTAAVDELADAVRDAAARALFVYPPPESPEERTAYRALLELEERAESLGGDAATRAESLRHELAETLVFLGDRYWEVEGGRGFAIDYYAQALLFDPTSERARERGGLTPGQLAELEEKANRGAFTERELVVAEPLAVMADLDTRSRNKRLAALVTNDDRRGNATVDAQIQTILGELKTPEAMARAKRTPPTDSAGNDRAQEPEPEVPDDEAAQLEVGQDSADGATSDQTSRDPVRAREVATRGRQALRAGDFSGAEKLFHQALRHDRSCGAALIGLADVHFELAEHGKAVTYAEKAVRVAPKHAGYRLKLGDAYFKVLRYDDARQQYERAEAGGDARATARLTKLDERVGR